jgi:hypothetical protein
MLNRVYLQSKLGSVPAKHTKGLVASVLGVVMKSKRCALMMGFGSYKRGRRIPDMA